MVDCAPPGGKSLLSPGCPELRKATPALLTILQAARVQRAHGRTAPGVPADGICSSSAARGRVIRIVPCVKPTALQPQHRQRAPVHQAPSDRWRSPDHPVRPQGGGGVVLKPACLQPRRRRNHSNSRIFLPDGGTVATTVRRTSRPRRTLLRVRGMRRQQVYAKDNR